ncbi:MAG: cation:proton antiporter [Solirubrobacterales bacterium]
MEIEFTNLLIVVAVGFSAPLLLGLAPGLRFPAVVLEIVAGIIVGPAVLGWVEIDEPVRVLSILGLAVLLFLAGLEIEYEKLRGRVARLAGGGFILSFAIAIAIGLLLKATDTVGDGLFVAIVLSATSLGVVIPVLKDSGNIETGFGQLVVAAASIADFATIILLTLLFSEEASSTTSTLLLLGSFFVLTALLGLAIAEVEHLGRVRDALLRLQDTTAQIRIRGAFVLMVGLTALATNLGLELILGSFLAGGVLKLVDRDTMMTHPQLREKLEAVGFGVFIPVFFVATGVAYDLDALGEPSTLVQVPIFLAAMVAVRGLPALLYRGELGDRKTLVAALLQATSLPFIVAATAIGIELGAIEPGTAAAFIAAGLLSVVVFPATALGLLGGQSAE